MKALATALALLALIPAAGGARAADQRAILLQSTTSTANSGLYDHLLPRFTAETGIAVRVVAVGTGQAIRNARNCDGDVLLVHARAAEEAFVAAGFGTARHDLMVNDFVIVGPAADPAGIAGMTDAAAALARIAAAGARFASRGDDSGTHSRERALWAAAERDPVAASGTWYREMGTGMGATLNAAVGMGAYTLTDRATWVSFANKADFAVLVAGDPALVNQYGVIAVSSDACPKVNAAGSRRFVDWLLSDAGQGAIAAHRVDGEQLFFPNAAVRDGS
ncbi:MAG: substrate-binding domain-containing protein [Pseudomonadota bacterium]